MKTMNKAVGFKWRHPNVSYVIRAFVMCLAASAISFAAVGSILKPQMRESGVFVHVNLGLTQDLLSAQLRGKSYDEILQYLSARSDETLMKSQIIEMDDLLNAEASAQMGSFLKDRERWKLSEGRPVWTGKPRLGMKPISKTDSLIDPFWLMPEVSQLDKWRQTRHEGDAADHGKRWPGTLDYRLIVKNSHQIMQRREKPKERGEYRPSYAVVPIGGTPYAIVAHLRDSFAPEIQADSIILSTVVVLFILVIAALVIIAPILIRVRRIEETCMLVSRGDFAARCNDKRTDSLGLLAMHIDEMTSSIEKNFAQQKGLLQAVSHELRTPLSRIRFTLELLDIDENDEKSMSRLESIDDDLTEIDNLLHELGYFNYVDAGKGRQNFELIGLNDLLQDTLRQRAQAIGNFDVKISGVDDEMALEVDPTAFKRVIGNLLSNAARYAHEDIAINACIKDDGRVLEIAVEDDGPGIPEDKRQAVLEPFVCLDKSRSKAFGGVGLGLAIVDRIMKMHKGTISIETSAKGGARMVTHWPVHQDEGV